MKTRTINLLRMISLRAVMLGAAFLLLWPGIPGAVANPKIRAQFFNVYPAARGTRLDTLPSNDAHCGVCHWDFNGGGERNPHGISVQNALPLFPNTDAGKSNAIYSVRNLDPDGDGYSSWIEVTDTNSYNNTPAFPGLTAGNVGQVANVSLAEIQDYLTPRTTVDTNPPSVTLLFPNGGQVITANRATNVTWNASDPGGIASVNIYVSFNHGVTFEPVAFGLPNTGSYSWVAADRPTSNALIRVMAADNALNVSQDQSDAVFRIVSPPGGRVATTLRDFDMPGTQPFEGGNELDSPANCAACHGNYNSSVEPYFNWQGSMMAQASRDILFEANMAIANQDAPNSGDLCLRCHFSRGWLQGRSVPTDGSRMVASDFTGVSCDLCHRMVKPVYTPGASPTNDLAILARLSNPGTNFGNGMFVIDPNGIQRGPFTNPAAPHTFYVSSFHREAAFCGTCHDVSNPAFQKDAQGNYLPNALNSPATNFSPHAMAPVERTYSEWLNSEFNTPTGVSAPEFAGNKSGGRVATCQDCHMRDVSGQGCNPATNPGVPTRPDLPLHDMVGGSTWLPLLLTNLYPGDVNPAALQAGVARAGYMLSNAADLAVALSSNQLRVTVTNKTGHKLPTGYPEGRRMWLNVKFYNAATNLVGESGAYDPGTGVLSHDPQAKVYEVHPGMETNLATALTLPAGPSFHFVLNNKTYSDNRIPPRGFTNANFQAFGGAPAQYSYADGQYWDDTVYPMPAGAVRAEARLYYQSTSKEFIEFLRDENITNTKGQELFNLWNTNGKCPPVLMDQAVWVPAFVLQSVRFNARGGLEIRFLSRPGTTYRIQFADGLNGTPVWRDFQNNGTLTATNTQSLLVDDFTANSSGGPSATRMRFYRFNHDGSP